MSVASISSSTAHATTRALQSRLVAEASDLYSKIPGGVFDNPNASAWIVDQQKLISGEDADRIGDRVTQWLTDKGYTVTTEALEGTTRGETDGRAMTTKIIPGLDPIARAYVLLHEAGHVICEHFTDESNFLCQAFGNNWCEIEAETVAYIVGSHYGMDLDSTCVPYVANWAEGDLRSLREFSKDATRYAVTLKRELDRVRL